MSRPLLLGLVLGAILAAAVLGARAMLEAPIDVPKVELPPPRPQVLTTTTQIVRSPELAADAPPVVAAPQPPPPPPPPHPAAAIAAVVSPPIEPPEAPTPDNGSPFANDHAPEIEHAFSLAIGPESTVESAQRAAEIFERCLTEVPTSHRCYQGLSAAQARQQPGWVPPPRQPTTLAPKAVDPLVPLRLPAQLRGGLRRLPREQQEVVGSEQ